MTFTDITPPRDPGTILAPVVEQLRAEVDGLRRAMHTRGLIEQAKGVLMARHQVTAEEAFTRLRRISERSNVKLAEVAAELIAQHVPPPEALPGPLPASRRPAAGRRPGRRPAEVSATGAPAAGGAAPHARHLLTTARLAAAESHDEVVAALAEPGPGWPVPKAVVLTVAEPDGALRVTASRGLPHEMASQWHRIPPQVDVPLAAAARTGEPVWLPHRAGIRQAYPLMARLGEPAAVVTLPLRIGGRLLGVLGYTWSTEVELDPLRRSYLLATAAAAARAVRRMAPSDAPDAPVWVDALLDGALTPAAVLTAVGPEDEPTDFRFAQANPAAEEAAARRGHRLAGATLLTVMPAVGAAALLPLFRSVLADGRPRQLDELFVPAGRDVPAGHYRVRAVRLGNRVLTTWHRLSPGDLRYDDLIGAGELAGVATFRWQLATGELRASPNLGGLLGGPAGPLTGPRAALLAVRPDQRTAVLSAAVAALRGHRPMAMTVAVGRSWLRVTAERVVERGGVVALRGLVQDVTDLHLARGRERRLAEARATARLPGRPPDVPR